jgi:hypothetical protein
MDSGKSKSRDFRLSQALATRWFKRLRAATSFFAGFRPLFRLGGRWSASIPSDHSLLILTAAARCGAAGR